MPCCIAQNFPACKAEFAEISLLHGARRFDCSDDAIRRASIGCQPQRIETIRFVALFSMTLRRVALKSSVTMLSG